MLHWTTVIVFNSWNVDRLAVIHTVPLLISYQLAFVSSVLGLSLHIGLKVHQSLAIMALVQGMLHSIIYLQAEERQIQLMFFPILVFVH